VDPIATVLSVCADGQFYAGAGSDHAGKGDAGSGRAGLTPCLTRMRTCYDLGMTVRAKINVAILVVAATFVVLIGGLILALRITSQLDGLRLAAVRVSGDVYRITDVAKELILTHSPLNRKIGGLDRSIERFDSSLATLAEHPALPRVGEEAVELIERTRGVWEIARPDLLTAQSQLNTILDDTSIANYAKTGVQDMQQLARERNDAALLELASSAANKLRAFEASGKEIVVGNLEELVEEVRLQSERTSAVAYRTFGIAALILVVVSNVLVFRFTRQLSHRIREMRNGMSRLAERDLTARYNDRGSDEVADLARYTNSALGDLCRFMRSVQEASGHVQELKDGLSSGTSESAASLNQITRNIESIGTRFETLTDNVSRSSKAIERIDRELQSLTGDIDGQAGAISESASSIEEMNASIQSIRQVSSERKEAADTLAEVIRAGGERIQLTNESIRAVSDDVDDILEIIEIINTISEQTDLLSMNAAIESAHAGEAGKGFAVVAEEIRKLAESSGENAGRIGELLHTIAARIKEALGSSEEAAATFERIDKDVSVFSGSMDEIVSSMSELSEGSSSILDTTNEISHTTERIQSFARDVKESSATIREAMESADGLSEEMSNGINEIDRGAKEILNALNDISQLSVTNKERMERLEELVSQFTTESA
jgi:methyl-accepting chemotaxis protein